MWGAAEYMMATAVLPLAPDPTAVTWAFGVGSSSSNNNNRSSSSNLEEAVIHLRLRRTTAWKTHVTRHTSQATRHTSHVTRYLAQA